MRRVPPITPASCRIPLTAFHSSSMTASSCPAPPGCVISCRRAAPCAGTPAAGPGRGPCVPVTGVPVGSGYQPRTREQVPRALVEVVDDVSADGGMKPMIAAGYDTSPGLRADHDLADAEISRATSPMIPSRRRQHRAGRRGLPGQRRPPAPVPPVRSRGREPGLHRRPRRSPRAIRPANLARPDGRLPARR